MVLLHSQRTYCPRALVRWVVSCRFLSLAAGTPLGAPPQQRMAAEGALNLALRLGNDSKAVLHHLMQSASFYESYRWAPCNSFSCVF